MFVASIAFTYAFTPKDYQLNSKTRVRLVMCLCLPVCVA
jgi:hypothetical protein